MANKKEVTKTKKIIMAVYPRTHKEALDYIERCKEVYIPMSLPRIFEVGLRVLLDQEAKGQLASEVDTSESVAVTEE